MTNVISFARKEPLSKGSARYGALTSTFANARRVSEDVFWLKENAELLNILQATQAAVPETSLEPYREFYDSALERMSFFPQYYRFLLGIVLDLEDLGLTHDVGAILCDHVGTHKLYDAELSDLQRGETMRLLARRGQCIDDKEGLTDRLTRFARRSATFAVPNRKAAYELTHILFYLSDYGRTPLTVDKDIERSLVFTGIIALLEDNLDLLAEVCVAMRYGGLTPPDAWRDVVRNAAASIQVRPHSDGQGDDYHCYLMLNWSLATEGLPFFGQDVDGAGASFHLAHEPLGALRGLSYMLYNHSEYRVNDWNRMKQHASRLLSAPVLSHIDFVQSSCGMFDEFFEAFVHAAPRSDTDPVQILKGL